MDTHKTNPCDEIWASHREALSKAFSCGVRRYQLFQTKGPEGDCAKDFAAYQAGCKAAISHLETVLKLISTLDGQTDPRPAGEARDKDPSDSLEQLLAAARAELNTHKMHKETQGG